MGGEAMGSDGLVRVIGEERVMADAAALPRFGEPSGLSRDASSITQRLLQQGKRSFPML